jgi:glycosidase
VQRGSLVQNGVGKFNDIDDSALDSIRKLGTTHLWLLGVMRQATLTAYPGLPADPPEVVKGIAGCYYAIKDLFDVCPDYASSFDLRMQEFEALVRRVHAHGMRVLVDLVPNHVARGYHSSVRPELDFGRNDDRSVFFKPSNNFFYLVQPASQRLSVRPPESWWLDRKSATFHSENGLDGNVPRATGNNQTSPRIGRNDWYDTVKLNYGYDFVTQESCFDPIPPTWAVMDEVIAYWQKKGVDGFRCDFAHWIPLEFWSFAIGRARSRDRHVYFLAEAFDNADAVPGFSKQALVNCGFDAVYDSSAFCTIKSIAQGLGWANDLDLLLDKTPTAPMLTRYLENHDERRAASPVVRDTAPHNSGLGSPSLSLAAAHALWLAGQGPMLLYAGQELGEPGADAEGFSGSDGRTTIFDYWSVDSYVRWCSDGKWDLSQSTPQQRALRQAYEKLIRLARSAEFEQGTCYGLGFENRKDWSFGQNGRWIFAFVRKVKGSHSAFIPVINLSPTESFDFRLRIPHAALHFHGWPDEGQVVVEPTLVLGKPQNLSVSEAISQGIPMNLGPSQTEVFRFSVRGDS